MGNLGRSSVDATIQAATMVNSVRPLVKIVIKLKAAHCRVLSFGTLRRMP